jgi:hypothetical protein
MLSLRNNPIQHYVEDGPKGSVEIEYNLILPEKNS